jgi:hypothetical protein
VFVFRLSFLGLKRYPKNAWLQMRQRESSTLTKKYDFRCRRRNPYDVAQIATVAARGRVKPKHRREQADLITASREKSG